jgi:hypothetical protein
MHIIYPHILNKNIIKLYKLWTIQIIMSIYAR